MDQFCSIVDLGGKYCQDGLFTMTECFRRNGDSDKNRIRALLFSVILQRPYRIRWMYVI